jgi:hypothetical protein
MPTHSSNQRSIAFVAAVAGLVASCGHAIKTANRRTASECAQSDVVASDAESIEVYRGCREVKSLRVRSGATLTLSALAELQTVAGDIVVGPSIAVDDVSLPKLRRVGGVVRVSGNMSLTGWYAPELVSVAGVEVADNPVLATLALPRVEHVTRDVTVQRNPALSTILLANLSAIDGALILVRNRQLNIVTTHAAFRASRVEMTDLPALDWTTVPGAPIKPATSDLPASSAPDPEF